MKNRNPGKEKYYFLVPLFCLLLSCNTPFQKENTSITTQAKNDPLIVQTENKSNNKTTFVSDEFDTSVHVPFRISKDYLHIKDSRDTSITIRTIDVWDHCPFLQENEKEKWIKNKDSYWYRKLETKVEERLYYPQVFSKNNHLILAFRKKINKANPGESCIVVFDKKGKLIEVEDNCSPADFNFATLFNNGRYLVYQIEGCKKEGCYTTDTVSILIKDVLLNSFIDEPAFQILTGFNDSKNILITTDIISDLKGGYDTVYKIFDFKNQLIYEGGRHPFKDFYIHSTNKLGIKIKNRNTNEIKELLFNESFEVKELK